jgi:hypothetical protein
MVFLFNLLYLGQDERILNFFNFVSIVTDIGGDLAHLAHEENTQREIFL